MQDDHYANLGVAPDASREEVRAAYLRVMRAHHPDRRPDDPAAGTRARAANAAWRVLADPARRAAYDRVRRQHDALHEAAGGTVSDIALARATAAATRSYSPEQAEIRRAFGAASLRLGVVVFLIGTVVLFMLH